MSIHSYPQSENPAGHVQQCPADREGKRAAIRSLLLAIAATGYWATLLDILILLR